MATKITGANFPEGISLWVSSKCVAKSGNDAYWATIDEFNDGALLYLSHSVWEDLPEVNRDTVFDKLNEGGFEITEAKLKGTNKPLVTDDGEQIYQISKAKATKKFTLTC
jgi:hypothetical protein